MSTVRCWRCGGKGHLGKLPSGAYLIDKVCNGSGVLRREHGIRVRSTRWQRIRDAWRRFVSRNITCDEEEL